ncbi:FKBP12-associated protein [Stygiomarasmius scandens]|uniref:FKBP12-associated protein n=1 Tax=Marasmiellus scandens TaxID=2682957 RepID=A0ABR1ISX4_9AGAR
MEATSTQTQTQTQNQPPKKPRNYRNRPPNNNSNTNTPTPSEDGEKKRRPPRRNKPRVKEDKEDKEDKGKETEKPPRPRRAQKFNPSLTTTTPNNEAGPSKPRNRYKNQKDLDSALGLGTDLTSNLIRGLSKPPYADCPICFNAIFPGQSIWSCSPMIPILSDDADKKVEYCWTPFHLKCIKPWAEKSFNDVKAAWVARGEPEKGGEWRCPGCQGRRNRVVGGYLCFCGSTSSPQAPTSRLTTPHSCGNRCSRPRESCSHPCPLLCHPGPCPPCKVVMDVRCHCIRQKVIGVLCGDARTENTASSAPTSFSCGEPCHKPLSCGNPAHVCTKPCHLGPCDACPERLKQKCWCGKEEREVPCGEGETWADGEGVGCDGAFVSVEALARRSFRCAQPCSKPFNCGKHFCEKPCHPPSPNSEIAHCPSSPDMIKTCPCGKRDIASSTSTSADAFPPRTSCTSPIPTCSSPCLKPLTTCEHTCQSKCHTGPCPPCSVELTRPCRCGGKVSKIQCSSLQTQEERGEPLVCDKPCLALRSCGKHQCGRICCPLASFSTAGASSSKVSSKKKAALAAAAAPDPLGLHECELICGKPLSCGNHTCEEKDHRGPCKPCLRSGFDEMTCFCGQTTLFPPIPCGTTLASVSKTCPHPCPLPPPACGHEKVPHTCHAPPEVDEASGSPCPGCVRLVTKRCACGKKEVPNVRCSLEREKVGCGLVCGRLLSCGFHKCERKCHSESEDCGQCTSVCGKDRKLCLPAHHPCSHPCHAPSVCNEDTPCQSLVSITCPCGRIKQSVRCGRSTSNLSGTGEAKGKELKCNSDCGIAERNRRLADALGISTSRGAGVVSGGGVGAGGEVVYNDEVVSFARREGRFLGVVERAFADFVTSSKRSQVLPHMPPERRKFVHDLAAVYRMDTQLIDQEPYRSVQIIRRIDTRIPTPTLSSHISSLGPLASSSSSALGKLADIRLGSGAGGGPWRSATATTTTGPVTAKAQAGAGNASSSSNRGWTSVVAPSTTNTGPGSGTTSPWGGSRSTTPLPQGRSAGPGAGSSVQRTPAAAPKVDNGPGEEGLREPVAVPDDWEDDA